MPAKTRLERWGAPGLGFFAFALFAATLATGFVYDDVPLIVDNAYVHSFDHLRRAFGTHFWDTARGDYADALRYYRPLVSLSYMLDWQLGGGAAWPFHLSNTLWHAGSVWLAARLCQRALPKREKLWLLPAALFAFHATRLESVAWIAGRTDLLLTFWLLLALEAADFWRRSHSALALAGVFACSLAALLSKETALVLPLLLLADHPAAAAGAKRRLRPELLVAGGVVIAYLVGRELWLPVGSPGHTLTPVSFLAAVEGYAERLFWPSPRGFFFRSLVVGEHGLVHPMWQVVLGALASLVMLGLLGYAFRKRRSAFWWLLTSVVGLAPVLHLVPTGLPVLVADRFWYLPLLALALGVCQLFEAPQPALRRLTQHLTRRAALYGALLSLAPLGCLWSLVATLPAYTDGIVFWNQELARDSCNPNAHDYLSNVSARQGELEAATRHLARVLDTECVGKTLAHHQLPLTSYARLLQLEAALTADGDRDRLRALARRLRDLFEGHPASAPRVRGLAEPATQFFDHLTRKPRRLPQAGNVAAELAGVEARLGNDAEAERWARVALARAPSQLSNPAQLVLTLGRIGRLDLGRALIQRLREAKPSALLTAGDAQDLEKHLAFAEDAERAAKARPSPEQAAVLRAQAQADLGAYGRAVGVLAPFYRADPKSIPRVLYVQLLVAARLEGRAYDVVVESQPPDRARRIIGQIQSSLSPELRRIAPVEASGSN